MCLQDSRRPQRMRALAHDIPAPTPGQHHQVAVVQPALVGRLGQAIGIDAADVLP